MQLGGGNTLGEDRQAGASRRVLNWGDAGALLFFAFVASTYQMGRWQGMFPFIELVGDSGNLASYAAVLDHPEMFLRDSSLNDPANFGFYWTIHVPLLRLLTHLTGDYGTSQVLLAGPHIFVQCVAFYIFGRVLWRSRYWGFLWALINLAFVSVYLGGDYWGIYQDALPRSTFQALLALLLAAAVRWHDRPRAWVWIMAGSGLMMYVHPVSAPAWMFSLWLSAMVFLPEEWSWRRRLSWLVMLGSCAVAVALPFALNYFAYHGQGRSRSLSYTLYNSIFTDLYRSSFSFSDLAGKQTWKVIYHDVPRFFFFWSVAGVLLTWWMLRRKAARLKLLLAWAVGLYFISAFVPIVEQQLDRALNWLPVQFSLIRNQRFLLPGLLLFCLWPLAEISARLAAGEKLWSAAWASRGWTWGGVRLALLEPVGLGEANLARWRRRLRIELGLVGLMLTLSWSFAAWGRGERRYSFMNDFADGLCVWRGQRVQCRRPEWWADQDLIAAIKEQTRPGERLFTTLPLSLEVAIRYCAHRPLAYSYEDFCQFAYQPDDKLVRWYKRYKQMYVIRKMRHKPAQLAALVDLARECGADFVVLNKRFFRGMPPRADAERLGLEHLWSSWRDALYRLRARPTPTAVASLPALDAP